MTFYEDLVNYTQMNYSNRFDLYRQGKTVYELSKKEPLPYKEQIELFRKKIMEADCVIVGGASGLSAAGGGDFYYDDTPSYRKYFGKYAEKYGFKGAFDGSFYPFDDPAEKWGYLATFLNTTQRAEIRKPYLDLNELLMGKEFFILTTNQDTQFVKLYPEDKVAEIQGDHRFFQCSKQCTDDTWDAVEPVKHMIEAMGEDTAVPKDLIPRCPHCGAEAFPWVRGYGNFLQGKKYEEEYGKISDYIQAHKDEKILFLELGVGRMTPMFIQEPFWELTRALPDSFYISLNDKFDLVPEGIEDRAMAIKGDIAKILEDDEENIRELVKNFLINDGHDVSSFPTGDELYDAFEQEPCELVILDIMMPGSDGITILTKLRSISKVPVILLTAKDSDSDYYNGLALGSDDYMTKPFKPMLLLAKVKAILRRVNLEREFSQAENIPENSGNHNIKCGNLEYHEKEHEITVGGQSISLTPTEMKFLIYMMEHFNEAVKKNVILDEVWGMDSSFETRVADETNRRMRKKLLDAGSDVYIQTVWGYGFKLTYKE